jgi:hypothetical protein
MTGYVPGYDTYIVKVEYEPRGTKERVIRDLFVSPVELADIERVYQSYMALHQIPYLSYNGEILCWVKLISVKCFRPIRFSVRFSFPIEILRHWEYEEALTKVNIRSDLFPDEFKMQYTATFNNLREG